MKEDNFSEVFVVSDIHCISEIDSSLPNILGTYTIVKWMEIVSAKNINRELDEKYITVGKEFSIEHIGMAKIGDNIHIASKIESREKRKIEFVIIATLNNEIIAKATHKRIIIPAKLLDRIT